MNSKKKNVGETNLQVLGILKFMSNERDYLKGLKATFLKQLIAN